MYEYFQPIISFERLCKGKKTDSAKCKNVTIAYAINNKVSNKKIRVARAVY